MSVARYETPRGAVKPTGETSAATAVGIGLMAVSALTIPMGDGIAKELSATHSPLFISWARYALSKRL